MFGLLMDERQWPSIATGRPPPTFADQRTTATASRNNNSNNRGSSSSGDTSTAKWEMNKIAAFPPTPLSQT